MKHLLILFLLVFGITAFSYDLTPLLKYQHLDLTYGIPMPPEIEYNNFTNAVSTAPVTHVSVLGESLFDQKLSDSWYQIDFAEDPFDGMIEVLAVGQPSASVNATLIISCLIGLVMFCKRKQAIARLSL